MNIKVLWRDVLQSNFMEQSPSSEANTSAYGLEILGSDAIHMFISVFTWTQPVSLSRAKWTHSNPILYI